MAREQSAFVNWSQYLALRGVSGFLQCFDHEQNLETAASVGSLFFASNQRRRERAMGNLRRSFPDWDEDRIEDVARRSFQHMFQLFMVDTLVMPRLITPSTWQQYIELGEIQPLLDAITPGQPALLLTGHCGNWELLGFLLSMLGYPISALARPLDNPLINDWLLGIREAHGLQVITKWGATPILQEALRDGRLVGFIADQNAGEGGLFVPFFGRLASSYKSIALLAMRYRCPVIAGHATRKRGMKYRVDCVDVMRPEDWEAQPDPLFYITARANHAMETMIRRAPEQYLWLHRRWKSRPRHERIGRPVPRKLRERIESLPWLSDEAAAAVIADSDALAAKAPPAQ